MLVKIYLDLITTSKLFITEFFERAPAGGEISIVRHTAKDEVTSMGLMT
jgi:hypothetical protein